MMKSLILLPLLLAATPLFAATEKPALPGEPPPPRIATLVVYGDDPCPRSKDEEIIVCARQPESDRYRIPKQFRKKKVDDGSDQTWTERTRTLDMVSQKGLPDSCSPHGSGGQTGCMRKFLEAARAEREAAKQGQ